MTKNAKHVGNRGPAICKALFKSLMKRYWILWAIFAGLMTFYFTIVALTFFIEPDAMIASMEMMGNALGADIGAAAFTAYTFFDFVVPIYGAVFFIIFAVMLVHRAVFNNSMSAFLSTPLSRKNYIVTSAVFFITVIASVFLMQFLIGIPLFLIIGGSFNILYFGIVVFVSFLCTLSIAMICFFCSCAFAGSGKAMGFIIGIPIVFTMFLMISQLVPPLDFLQYLTPYGWFDTLKVAAGIDNLWWLWCLIYAAISGALFFLSVFIFKRKQLSI
jgi:hypothetical protein